MKLNKTKSKKKIANETFAKTIYLSIYLSNIFYLSNLIYFIYLI